MRLIRLTFTSLLLSWLVAAPAFAQAASVSVVDSDFEPAELEISSGTEVTWTNNGDLAHTVTADDGSFDSGNLDPGDTFSFTFNNGDEFPYFCEYHGAEGGTGMAATIVLSREPTDPGDGNGNGDDNVDDTTDELPTTGPADLWAFVYVGLVFLGAGGACLRVARTN